VDVGCVRAVLVATLVQGRPPSRPPCLFFVGFLVVRTPSCRLTHVASIGFTNVLVMISAVFITECRLDCVGVLFVMLVFASKIIGVGVGVRGVYIFDIDYL
jgi:hypothetical protein